MVESPKDPGGTSEKTTTEALAGKWQAHPVPPSAPSDLASDWPPLPFGAQASGPVDAPKCPPSAVSNSKEWRACPASGSPIARKPPPSAGSSSEGFMDKFCGCLPVFLLLCGLALGVPLFIPSCTRVTEDLVNHYNPRPEDWSSIGWALFVVSLLFGIAGIIHRLNQKKGD